MFETVSCLFQVPEIDGTTDKGEMPASLSGDIDFVGVDFTYPTREDVKVKIPAHLDIFTFYNLIARYLETCEEKEKNYTLTHK